MLLFVSLCLVSLAGASKPAVQDVPPSAATASVAASPAATAPAAESPAAAVHPLRSHRRPAALWEQQAGDMTIATFECGSRLGSWFGNYDRGEDVGFVL